jgi:hypothetical protein
MLNELSLHCACVRLSIAQHIVTVSRGDDWHQRMHELWIRQYLPDNGKWYRAWLRFGHFCCLGC